MKIVGALLIAGMLALAAPAYAVLLVTPQGQPVGGKWQRWANRAKVPTPGVQLRLVLSIPKPCRPANGCIQRRGRTPVAIYINPGASDARFALLHEIGHAFDALYLTTPERHRFEYLDGWDHHDPYGYIPWSVRGADPPGSPIEDFANTYASCAIYGLYPRTWYMNEWPGWDCSWASYRAACVLIRRAA